MPRSVSTRREDTSILGVLCWTCRAGTLAGVISGLGVVAQRIFITRSTEKPATHDGGM